MMPGEDIELAYGDDARSLHTVLRITNPDSGEVFESMFDNLTTPMYLLVQAGLKPTQEFVGFQRTEGVALSGEITGGALDGVTVMADDWRQYASGDTEEALFIEAIGDPVAVFGEEWVA